MPPNLFDKLLDALGLLPFGAILRLRRLRQLWRRLSGLRETLDRIADQLRRARQRLDRARGRIRRLAERRDALNRDLTRLREELRRARSSVEQRLIEGRIRRAQRELDQVFDDMAPSFDEITDAEANLRGVEARQREYDFMGKEILTALAEFFLPMALLSCVAHALGIDLIARANLAEQGPFSVDGEFARYDGSAIAGEVVLLCRGHVPVEWTTTDGSGRFEFGNLAPGEYTVAGLTDALCMRRFTIGKEDCSVQLGPVEHKPHIVRVRDHAGQPMAGVTVVLCGFNMERVETITIAETHESGMVCLPRHAELNSALLLYQVSDHGVTLLHTDIMPLEYKPYSKLKVRSHPIRAAIFNAKTGGPVDGVQVTALPLDGEYIAGAFGRLVGFRATTDASGAMNVYGPRAGRYRIALSAPGFKVVTTEIDVYDDRVVHLGAYKMKPLKESGHLMGVIRDPLGQPSSGYVSLVKSNGKPTGYRAFSDPTGLFEFEGLPPGEYYIEVQGERPSELGRRKVTIHANKRIEAIITLMHSLDFE